jgi:hypothetical protein
MRLLLDTHVLLWAAAAPEKLSAHARARIEDADNLPVFSAANIWEVAIKNGLGRYYGITVTRAKIPKLLPKFRLISPVKSAMPDRPIYPPARPSEHPNHFALHTGAHPRAQAEP